MRITIQGVDWAPRWETLQAAIREALNDETATLVRLSRLDGGCNYRKPGAYNLELMRDHGRVLEQVVYRVREE